MTDQPHRITWFHPDRPVDGGTTYVRPDDPQLCHNCDERIHRCPHVHPEYGFTCVIPGSHAGPHFDLAGGHWNEEGQVKAWSARGNRGRPLASTKESTS